jgi:uncharacterized membrane protein
MKIIIMYLLTAVVFFGIDIFWIGFAAKKVYGHYMGNLLRPNPLVPAATLFYLLYIAGMLYFAIYPGLEEGSLQQTVIKGALYGFFTYMTYELTSLAVVQKWPWQIVPIDIAWGVFLSASVSSLVFIIASNWLV